MTSKKIVGPGAIERYLSCGETIAAWKSIECIIGAAVMRTPGTGSSLRLVMLHLMRSPTRAGAGRAELDAIADAGAHGRSRHRVAEGPGAELHARRDFDDLVGGVEADRLHL